MSLLDRAIYSKQSPKSVGQTIANNVKYGVVQDVSNALFGVKNEVKRNTEGEFSPDAFRASFADGIASPALFRLRLVSPPSFMQGLGLNTDALRLIPMRAKKAIIPDMALQTNQFSYYGIPRKYPYENSTGNLNVEVLMSGNLWEREFFTAWQNYIIDYGMKDKNPTLNVAYYNDYIAQIELDVYNVEGEIVTTIVFEECWPMTMTAVDMDWTSNEVMTFSVELAYSKWDIKHSKSEISKTVKEKTSPLDGILDAVKTLGVDKLRKTLNNLI